MSKEKQIEEMADVLERAKVNACATIGSMNSSFGMWYATALYTEGYRKQSEGEWVERIAPLTWCEDDVDVFYECSCCGTQSHGQSPFCPNCGARMGGGAE